MANFSENAVRQVIVAPVANAADIKVIDVKTNAVATADTEDFYIQYKNAEGQIVKSDYIKKGRVRDYRTAAYEAPTRRTVKVTVDPAALAPNTEYSMIVMIREVMSGSQEDQMTGIVSVTTSSATEAATLSKEVTDGLAAQINKMYGVAGKKFNHIDWPVLEAVGETGGTANVISIKEVDFNLKPWIVGKVQLRNYNFDIIPKPTVDITSTGNVYGESFDWLVPNAQGSYVEVTGGSLGHGYGKVAADLEYFYHGEIGDFYRMNNYPYNITTEYMVNPASTYDTVDLAFFYRGEATSPQASEKQLLILCEHGTDGAILTALKGKLDLFLA